MVNPLRDNSSLNNHLDSNGINIRERVFVVCGADFFTRKQALANIKKNILKVKPASLSTLTFYPNETDLKDLGNKLFSKSFSGAKIVIFKDFCGLSLPVRDLLFNNLKQILTVNYIIFETEIEYYQLQRNKKYINDKFFGFILKKAALFRVSSAKKENTIGDFINSVDRKDLSSSVYILESLSEGGVKEKALGPQIIGVLANRLSLSGNQSENLQYLWEADRAIKEKGHNTRLILEVLLTKLFADND
ncbi:MAG: hypothetical protein ABIH08_04820 [Candidatus Omnitrophota bacterium]